MKRFVIIGLGNFGSAAAVTLYEQGHEVIVVDTSEETIDRLGNTVTRAAVGDGRDVDTLKRVGVAEADAGVISTGDDIAASILATMALKDLGVDDIFVKVISRDHARVMEKIGVTETVFPEKDSAESLAQRITGKAVLNYVNIAPGFSLQEMAVPDKWCGKSLAQLDIRREFGVLVVALHDVLTDTYSAPDPQAVLEDSDTLLLAGNDRNLQELAEL
ncbi:MAG: TrkA family potassium uptake protein [Planctomycetota bacterium]